MSWLVVKKKSEDGTFSSPESFPGKWMAGDKLPDFLVAATVFRLPISGIRWPRAGNHCCLQHLENYDSRVWGIGTPTLKKHQRSFCSKKWTGDKNHLRRAFLCRTLCQALFWVLSLRPHWHITPIYFLGGLSDMRHGLRVYISDVAMESAHLRCSSYLLYLIFKWKHIFSKDWKLTHIHTHRDGQTNRYTYRQRQIDRYHTGTETDRQRHTDRDR